MKLFNFNCTQTTITDKIIDGCNIGLMDPNATKYDFYDIYKLMIACNWVPEEADLSGDKTDYEQLNPYEKRAYSKVLSQLIFMDSIQTENTSANVIPFVSDPVAVAALTRQAYEESLHSDSYYKMADSIYEEPEEIYNMWKEDWQLREKNMYIGQVYEKFSWRAVETDDTFVFRTGLLWNYYRKNKLMEGIEELIDNYIRGFEALTKLQKRKFTIRKELKKEEILNSIKNEKLKDIIRKKELDRISDLHLDYLKNALVFLEQEIQIFEQNLSYEEYLEKEEYERFRSRVLMIIANQALEGIYFYSGFVLIYLFGRQGKMLGSTTMIRFIHRDEINHTTLFSTLFKTLHKENINKFNKKLYEECVDILRNAAKLEIRWGQYVTQNKIQGINNEQIEQYIKFLANDRFKKLGLHKVEGLNLPFPEGPVKNPLPWVNKFSKLETTKTNFFEGDNKNYDNSGLEIKNFKMNMKLFQEMLKKENKSQ